MKVYPNQSTPPASEEKFESTVSSEISPEAAPEQPAPKAEPQFIEQTSRHPGEGVLVHRVGDNLVDHSDHTKVIEKVKSEKKEK